jgi:type II secretory pathway component PulJ
MRFAAVNGPRRSAFTITEMMLAISLLATFMAIGTKLLNTSLKLSRHTAEASDSAMRFDAVAERLRRDVWGAAALSTPDDRILKLTLSTDQSRTATWTIADDGSITRVSEGKASESDSPKQTWPGGVVSGMRFSVSGNIVVLGNASGDRHVTFVSQVAKGAAGR